MNNLKKLFAVVLTVAMLVTMFVTPAMAEEGTGVSANATLLESLQVVVGSGDGVTAEYLTTVPTREQAALMLLRLKGLEADAKAFTGTDSFSDAEVASSQWESWGNILAYLKANPEVGFEGIGGNEFGVGQEMSAKAYTKVLLIGLGYEYLVDFTWDTVFSTAAAAGLVSLFDKNTFTMDDLCESTVEALKTNKKGEEVTLASALAAAGAIDAQVAEDAGLVTPAPTPTPVALGVESVTAINLKQLEVVFNTEVDEDSAEESSNYDLDADNAELPDDSGFELQDDNMTVIITLEVEAHNQDEMDLTIENVEDINGEELDEVTIEDIEALDTTLPEALSAEVVGNDTIKVIFSEPMRDFSKDDFDVNDGDEYVSDVESSNNGYELNVELYSNLDEGTVSIEVGSGVLDYAGFGVLKKTFEIEVDEDEDAPVIVDYKNAEPDEVTLIFNEDIEINDDDLDNFYHSNSSNTAESIEKNGNELTLHFDEDTLLPEIAYIYIKAEAINDLWDNLNSKIVFQIEGTSDTTNPEVEDLEVTFEDQIVLTFSEDLDKDSAEDEDNYTLLDSDGDEVEDMIDDITYEDEVVTIDFEEDLEGDYSIVIEDVEDTEGNAIDDTTMEFTSDDQSDPDFEDFTATLYNPEKKGQLIRIDFGEVMITEGNYSIVDVEKYIVEIGTTEYVLADLDVEPEFDIINSGKSIEIEIASTSDDEDGVDLRIGSNSACVKMLRVADAAGNYTKFTGEIPLDDDASVSIDSVEATDLDKVVVTFDDFLEDIEDEDIVFYNTSGTKITTGKSVKSGKNNDGNTTMTYTINDYYELDYEAQYNNKKIYAQVVGTDSNNQYGETLELNQKVYVDDKIAPALIDDDPVKSDVGYITIQFTEPVDLPKADFDDIFEVEDYTVDTISGGGSTILKIILDESGEVPEEGTDVTQLMSIVDLNDNEISDIDEKVTVVAEDNDSPIFDDYEVADDNSYVDVTFSEAVYGDSSADDPVDKSAFTSPVSDNNTVTKNIDEITDTDGDPLVGGETTIRIHFNGSFDTAVGTETIEIEIASGTAIYDANGNSMPNGETYSSIELNDVVAPALASAEAIAKDTIEITFGEDVIFAIDQASFLSGVTATGLDLTGAIASINADVITITLASTHYIATDYNETDLEIVAGLLEDDAGNKNETISAETIADVAAPQFVSAVVDDSNNVTITFSETVTYSDETGFDIEIAGVRATITSIGGINTNKVTLTVSETISAGNSVTVEYNDSGNVEDEASISNALEDIEPENVTNNLS